MAWYLAVAVTPIAAERAAGALVVTGPRFQGVATSTERSPIPR